MPSKIYSIATIGLNCEVIEVEADISQGLPSFKIVGLGDTSVQEAKERVRSAIKNSESTYPIQKKTINLAPAEIKKQGSSFDLPIAISILTASNQIPFQIFKEAIVIGELSLDGEVKPIKGILPITNYAKKIGFKKIFLPSINQAEASLVEGIKVYGIESLKQLKDFCQGKTNIEPTSTTSPKIPKNTTKQKDEITFSQIFGLNIAKRALIIAAASTHNILLRGQPGTGKTVLARAFKSILPEMTLEEAFEVTKIYSISEGLPLNTSLMTTRPFRTLHHTASKISIIGGGTNLKPGEITLAHKGVLFMDEITEFPRNVLETLRQPLEDGFITINRAKTSMQFPCEFTLLAAMNNCPCGHFGTNKCRCTQKQISRYQNKLSGPLLDRFDMFIDTPNISIKNFLSEPETNEDENIKNKIKLAIAMQKERGQLNSKLTADQIRKLLTITPKAKSILDRAASKLEFSNRAYLKIIKVAQTIADLEQKTKISENEILEAIQYRSRILPSSQQ